MTSARVYCVQPLDPEISFGEDPLRMLRAARFIAGHQLRPVRDLVEAVAVMGDPTGYCLGGTDP